MKCSECAGTGMDPRFPTSGALVCPRCNGMGTIADEEIDRLAAIEQRLTVIEERLAALDTSQLAKDVERVIRKLTEPPPKVRR